MNDNFCLSGWCVIIMHQMTDQITRPTYVLHRHLESKYAHGNVKGLLWTNLIEKFPTGELYDGKTFISDFSVCYVLYLAKKIHAWSRQYFQGLITRNVCLLLLTLFLTKTFRFNFLKKNWQSIEDFLSFFFYFLVFFFFFFFFYAGGGGYLEFYEAIVCSDKNCWIFQDGPCN